MSTYFALETVTTDRVSGLQTTQTVSQWTQDRDALRRQLASSARSDLDNAARCGFEVEYDEATPVLKVISEREETVMEIIQQ